MKVNQLFEASPINVSTQVSAAMNKLNSVLRDYDWDSVENNIEALNTLNQAFANDRIEFLPNHDKNQIGRNGIAWGEYVADPTGKDDVIIVYTTPKLYRALQDPYLTQDVVTRVENILRHEYVHKEQAHRAYQKAQGNQITPFRASGDPDAPDRPYKQYLADPHEVQAHAHEAVGQLINKGVSKQEILDAIKTGDLSVLMKSPTYANYRLFVGQNRQAMNRLLKTMTQVITA